MKELINRNKAELIIVLIFMFYALGYNIYRVQGDGLLYYRFLERILNIPNPENPPAKVANALFFQAGCAYFNAPFYLFAYAVENIFKTKPNFNGITLRQIAINLASNFYMALSLILTVKILKKLKLKHIIFPVLGILVSTSALTVAVIMPSWPHSVDIFISTLFIYLILLYQNSHPAKTVWIGIVNVIAILCRYFNFILMFPLLIYYISSKEYRRAKFLLCGFLGMFLVIPLVLFIFNGTASPFFATAMTSTNALTKTKIVFTPYTYFIPFFPIYLLKLLVHPLHGLFIWAPLTILSAIGIIFAPKEKEKIWNLFIAIWFSFLFLYGFLPFWNAGWSFTNRYLVNLFPIYVIGLAIFLEKYGRKTYWFLIPLLFYSLLLFLNWHLCIMNGEYGTPGDAIQAWIKGESPTFICKTVNLKIVLNRLWEMCRYKYFFAHFK